MFQDFQIPVRTIINVKHLGIHHPIVNRVDRAILNHHRNAKPIPTATHPVLPSMKSNVS